MGEDQNPERTIRESAIRQFDFYCFSEELANPNNRISVDTNKLDSSGMPTMVINFKSDQYSIDGLDQAMVELENAGTKTGTFSILDKQWSSAGTHVTGTTIMGLNKDTSVVDTDCRSHDHPNLFIAGGGVFPSSSTAHPTLTIAALALRTADKILSDFMQ